jgi:hypothetical protein
MIESAIARPVVRCRSLTLIRRAIVRHEQEAPWPNCLPG